MDGIISVEEVKKCVENARKACEKIKEVQVKALKEFYGLEAKK